MHPGEIYLAMFPFGDVPGMKLRPVLLANVSAWNRSRNSGGLHILVVPIEPLDSDLLLDPNTPEFAPTNLKVTSVLRLHKLATIHCSSLARSLGTIDPHTRAVVQTKLQDLFAG
jgi:mRNA interferase MazF